MKGIMKLRSWWYALQPYKFEVAPCNTCGREPYQWSEYENHCWCDRCQKDYIPEHFGIFDGPIPVEVCYMLGLDFDRILKDGLKYDPFNREKLKWESQLKMRDALLAAGYSDSGLNQYTDSEIEKVYLTLTEGKLREIDKHHPSQRKIRKGTI